MVEMEDKCRKMAKLLKYHQAGKVGHEPDKPTAVYDQAELEKLTNEIAELEKTKKKEELQFKRQLKQQEQEKNDLDHEIKILALKLKEKRQEA